MLLYELLLEPIDRITLLQSPNQQPRPQKKVRFLCAFQNIPLTQTFHDHISKLSGLITFRKNVHSTKALSFALHISHQAKQRSLCLWLLIVGNSNLRLKWSEWLKRGHLIISHPFKCRLGESQGAICIQLEILFKPEPQKALQDCYEMCLINHQISSIGKYIIHNNEGKCVLFGPFWPQPTRDSNKKILTLPLNCSVRQWPLINQLSIITKYKYNFLWMIFRFNKDERSHLLFGDSLIYPPSTRTSSHKVGKLLYKQISWQENIFLLLLVKCDKL